MLNWKDGHSRIPQYMESLFAALSKHKEGRRVERWKKTEQTLVWTLGSSPHWNLYQHFPVTQWILPSLTWCKTSFCEVQMNEFWYTVLVYWLVQLLQITRQDDVHNGMLLIPLYYQCYWLLWNNKYLLFCSLDLYVNNDTGLVKEWNGTFQFKEIAWVDTQRSKVKIHSMTLNFK